MYSQEDERKFLIFGRNNHRMGKAELGFCGK